VLHIIWYDRCHFADTDVNVAVKGKGAIVLYNHDGTPQSLKNVLYAPSFSVNLISVSKADAYGFCGRWGHGRLNIEHASGQELLKSVLCGGMYHRQYTAKRFASPSVSLSSAPFAAVTKPDAHLVHLRYWHMGMSTLAKMASRHY
jgi:hypothetical protein